MKNISNSIKKKKAGSNESTQEEQKKDFKVNKGKYTQYLEKIGVFEKTKKPQMDGWIVKGKNTLRIQVKNRKGQQPTFNFFHNIGTDYVELDQREYNRVVDTFKKENKNEADD